MKNPFVFDRPLSDEPQIERREELAALIERFDDGVNTRMVSPRDYGKTSLLKQLCERLSLNDTPAVIVDLYGITNALELVRRVEAAYDDLPQGKWSRAIKGLRVRGGGGGFSTPAGGLSASVGAIDEEAALIAALNLPQALAKKTGDRVLVCFDEFQEVLKSDLDGKMRSAIQHHGDLVTYVFSGSHVGMMNELFADRSRPFFNQASPLTLGRFRNDTLVDFLVGRFEATGKSVDEVLDQYLDLVQGHPQRAMLTAHLIWKVTPPGAAADFEILNKALENAWPYLENEFEAVWDRLSALETGVVKAVAAGTASLRSKEAQNVFGLPPNSSGTEAAERLVKQGILIDVEPSQGHTRYLIDDPFFARWVASDRRWVVA